MTLIEEPMSPRYRTTAVLATIAILTFAACTPAPPTKYDDVTALREAFMKAGGTCNDWEQTNRVNGAAQSGTCDISSVLSVYLSREATEKRVADTHASWVGSLSGDWLVGDNWIIATNDVAGMKERLGGTIVSFRK